MNKLTGRHARMHRIPNRPINKLKGRQARMHRTSDIQRDRFNKLTGRHARVLRTTNSQKESDTIDRQKEKNTN